VVENLDTDGEAGEQKNGSAKKRSGGNGASAGAPAAPAADAPEAAGAGAPPQQLDPEIARKLAEVRSQVREAFGKVVMALMMIPRYRAQTLGDLQHLVLEPLIRDRVAIAYPSAPEQGALADMTGFAFWANVSEEVDARIREQIAAGVFPVRLKPEEWTSGSINWLLDVLAPDKRATASVIANFKQVVKEGSLRLHPLINRLVDEDTLKRMGAEKLGSAA
jgi:hemolysin-activating ACP:hemolysin acyltransferase